MRLKFGPDKGQEQLVGRTLVRLGRPKSALQGNREVISSQIQSHSLLGMDEVESSLSLPGSSQEHSHGLVLS